MSLQPWKFKGLTGDRKEIVITGPHETEMYIDRDDVDYKVVDIVAKHVVAVLNEHWNNCKFHEEYASLMHRRRYAEREIQE